MYAYRCIYIYIYIHIYTYSYTFTLYECVATVPCVFLCSVVVGVRGLALYCMKLENSCRLQCTCGMCSDQMHHLPAQHNGPTIGCRTGQAVQTQAHTSGSARQCNDKTIGSRAMQRAYLTQHPPVLQQLVARHRGPHIGAHSAFTHERVEPNEVMLYEEPVMGPGVPVAKWSLSKPDHNCPAPSESIFGSSTAFTLHL